MLQLWEKFLSTQRRRRPSLWYHPRYEAPSLARVARSLGMISLRGKRVLAQLAERGLVKAGSLRAFPLVPLADLALFHSPEYLEKAAQRSTLARIFGAPEEEVHLDEVLSAERWAVSGTLAAARAALAGPSLALNLGGGFHHAEPEMGSGFCVFNDIGVAIAKLRQEGFAEPVAIVDLDFHQGNGNLVGFLNDPSVHNYSLHGAVWTEKASVGHFNLNLEGEIRDSTYLKALESSLPDYLEHCQPGLVFYIAGHDVLELDPLGTFALSLEGVKRRDQLVLDLLRERKIPSVVTLAGGYSLQACQAALNLALLALEENQALAFDIGADASPEFRKLLHRLDPDDEKFRREDSWSFRESDLWPELGTALPSGGTELSNYRIELHLEKSGWLAELRAAGWSDLRLQVERFSERPSLMRLEGRRGESALQVIAEGRLEAGSRAGPEELRRLFR